MNRRHSIKTLALGSLGIAFSSKLHAQAKDYQKLKKKLSFGIITDVHIGFVKDAEQRLETFLDEMKEIKPTGLIQMGDFANPNAKHQPIIDRFNASSKHVIHTIGNHELDHGLTREHAKQSWGMPAYYYSKEVEGIKIIVLDGNDRGSPSYHDHGGYHSYIGVDQRNWLDKELEASQQPTLIVSHQPLAGRGAVDNEAQVCKILAPYKNKILACINGHSHVDQHLELDGIHYLHINSASYYWLGGKVRLAPYADSLYTVMTIDPKAGTITFTGKESKWQKGTPEEAGYFKDGKNAKLKDIVAPKISSRNFKF